MITQKNGTVFSVILFSVALFLVVLFLITNKGLAFTCPDPPKPPAFKSSIYVKWDGGCDGGDWIEFVEKKGTNFRFRRYDKMASELLIDAFYKSQNSCDLSSIILDSSFIGKVSLKDEETLVLELDKSMKQYCSLKIIYPALGGTRWQTVFLKTKKKR